MKKVAASRSTKAAGPYRFVGVTKEGVAIPAPKLKPTHFTSGQIRSVVKAAKAAASKGSAAAK